MPIIAPSILAADFTCLKDQIQQAEEAGADWFHLDIMDGHFVPNISFGPLVVEAVRKVTNKCLDVHLMIEAPDSYVPQFVGAGANIVSVHVETCPHLNRTVNLIKECGARPGVALNPATPAHVLDSVLTEVDLILAMSVNPGFGGQKFIPAVVPKIVEIADRIKTIGRQVYLEVDGGVDAETTPRLVKAGVDVLVAGSAIFGASDIGKALADIRKAGDTSLLA